MTIQSALYPGLTAMQAFGLSLQNTAHNLANVQTDGFKAGRMGYADLPQQSGVVAEGPVQDLRGGPYIPYGPGLPPPVRGATGIPGFVEGSNTDVATEMVNLIVTERGYQANAKTIQTADSMLGTVINLKV